MNRSTAPDMPPARRLSGMIAGLWVPQAVFAAAELGVADALAESPLSAPDVAARTGAHAGATERLLRALVALDVCSEHEGRFGLTELGRVLRADAPDSMRSVARLMGGANVWSAWSRLVDCVRNGVPAHALDGRPVGATFDDMDRDPASAAVFHEAMVAWTRGVAPGIVEAIDLGGARRVVDLGGGYGELLCTALAAHPHLEGCVFDLEPARAGALAHFARRGVAARASYVAGDLFESAPPPADAFLLKSVIHDWDDARSVRLLARCREAMDRATRLFLIEPPASSGPGDPARDQVIAFSDLNMLVNTGGQERTEAQYRALLESAELRVVSVRPTASFFAVFEAVRA
jgi:O-methyltransferase domain/Dimerisation domain